jgi:hypothetical protein
LSPSTKVGPKNRVPRLADDETSDFLIEKFAVVVAVFGLKSDAPSFERAETYVDRHIKLGIPERITLQEELIS